MMLFSAILVLVLIGLVLIGTGLPRLAVMKS
jgi:hypothetical protein